MAPRKSCRFTAICVVTTTREGRQSPMARLQHWHRETTCTAAATAAVVAAVAIIIIDCVILLLFNFPEQMASYGYMWRHSMTGAPSLLHKQKKQKCRRLIDRASKTCHMARVVLPSVRILRLLILDGVLQPACSSYERIFNYLNAIQGLPQRWLSSYI